MVASVTTRKSYMLGTTPPTVSQNILIPTRESVNTILNSGYKVIDWSNPITLGLKAVFDVPNAIEVITGNRANTNTSTRGVSLKGAVGSFASTANQRYTSHPNFAITGDLSIVVYCDVNALSNYGALIAKQATTTTNAPYELRLGVASTDSVLSLLRANASAFGSRTGSFSNTVTAGQKNWCAVLSVSGQDAKGPCWWSNGGTGSFSGTGAGTVTDNGSDVWIGRRFDGATQLDGKIYYIALYNRLLSEPEGRSIINNPAQIFKGTSTNIWVPA